MDEKVKNLIRILLTDSDPDKRRNAAEELANHGDSNVLAALSVALQDKNKGVADATARSLLVIGGVAAARAIVYHIEDEDIASRNLAAKLLIKLGESAIHAIVPYLRDANKDIRKIAVDILGEIRSREPLPYLLPLLKDTDPNVLSSVFEALGNIRSGEAIKPIFHAFEQFPLARIIAIEALGKIGGNPVREYLEGKLREAIIAGNAESIYLFALLDALGIVGDSNTLELLLANYEKFQQSLKDVLLHEVVQITERCNLEYQFEENTRNDLLFTLHNDNTAVKLSAAKGLVQFKDIVVTRELLLSLGISEEMDFVIIAQMSERPHAFQIAIECLESGMSRGGIQVIMLLGKIATEYIRSFRGFRGYKIDAGEAQRAFAAAIKYWPEANQEDWEVIAETLFRLDCDHASTFLYNVMVELDPFSRAHLIDQLLTMPTHSALECISRFAEDESEVVREAATSALLSKGYSAEKSHVVIKEPGK